MTDRVHIAEHYMLQGGVRVHLIDHHEETSFIERPSGWDREREQLDPAIEYPAPSFVLSESMARALMEALVRHFGGVSETQTLRKDYEAERARVDKFIDKAMR